MSEPHSASSTSLHPEDNSRLLAASAALWADSSKTERNRQVKRDVAVALERDPVLIATRDGEIVCEPGPTGGVLLCFTDSEAAAAWDALRHAAAPAADFVRSDELSGGGPPDRGTWLGWLQERGAVSVAVNPAGPLGVVVHRAEFKLARPRRLSRAVGADHPWLDLDARATQRRRIAELRTGLSEAVVDDDPTAFERFKPRLERSNDFGSMLWAPEMHYLGGIGLLRAGEEQGGLGLMGYGSVGFARIGDRYRSIDGLLDAAGRVLAVPTPKADWQIKYLNETVDVLAKMRPGYRDEEIQQVTDDAELAR